MSFFSWINWVDDLSTTIEASHEVEGLGVDRLSTQLVGQRWRSSSILENDGPVRVTLTYGQPRISRILMLQRPRLSLDKERQGIGVTYGYDDTIRHRLYAEGIDSAVVFDSGDVPSRILPGYGTHGLLLPDDIAHQTWEIQFGAQSRRITPENYIEFGRAWSGPAHIFETSYAGPFGFGGGSNASARRSASGLALHIRKSAVWRRFSVVFNSIRESERNALIDYLMATNDWSQHVIGFEAGRFSDVTDAERHFIFCAHAPVNLNKVSRSFSQIALTLQEAL